MGVVILWEKQEFLQHSHTQYFSFLPLHLAEECCRELQITGCMALGAVIQIGLLMAHGFIREHQPQQHSSLPQSNAMEAAQNTIKMEQSSDLMQILEHQMVYILAGQEAVVMALNLEQVMFVRFLRTIKIWHHQI